MKSEKVRTIGISVKVSDSDYVTCHQYTAEDFTTVLGAGERGMLARGFSLFQANPSWKSFRERLTAEDYADFCHQLGEHAENLARWALRGITPSQQVGDQIADILVFYSPARQRYRVVEIDAYIRELLNRRQRGDSPGKPFNWTYPHNCQGKSIQLKVPLVYAN